MYVACDACFGAGALTIKHEIRRRGCCAAARRALLFSAACFWARRHTSEPVPFNAAHSLLTFYRAAVEQAATFEAVQPSTGSYLS